MRTITIVLVASFMFTMLVMCAEPRYPSCRVFLFPGLAIVLGTFHAFQINRLGRSLIIWNLSTALNTLLYSALILLFLKIGQRFSSHRRA